MGDLPTEALEDRTPLEAAETPNMDFLAREGMTGLMYSVKEGVAPESDVAVLSILGYDPFQYEARRGPLEAYGAGLAVAEGDLALRCNFATLGEGGEILDRRVGRDITREEADELSGIINQEVELESHPATFEFQNTMGHRAALVIRSEVGSLSGEITNTDPAYTRMEGLGVAKSQVEMVLKDCEPLDESQEAKVSAGLVNEFVRKSHQVLESQELNERRAEEGRLKANLILTRDAGSRLPRLFKMDERYGVDLVCLADMPIERGIARAANLRVVDIPPPTDDMEEDCILRAQELLHQLPSYDGFYIHIKGPDVAGHDGKPHRKKQLIEGVDQFFFGNLLPKVDLEDCILCVTSDHSTPCKLKAHSDDPVPLLIAGDRVQADDVDRFSERDCKRGSLGVLERGTELMPRLMDLLKGLEKGG
ncbi:2,3-bisphosphoglycerate-independent phosphoglycerate mutase [Candidatus Bathyarchaeota archaeon]|nr:2,3-bisphosphoglycerate-independent phosphoglycerate mutase [Candidatus Bathyarchaeota archaeon]NIU81295.1 2,3-bisphosphoglycerate-independent phosphoglycerate mutase [Candidatus Bathyarchaeota archaeon]NIV67930.1 2,3-bisphosphoglycerate-independent phosphoglycerate mutase [Candidatus Bathyarchaeota archaeon]NIW16371.1 2,3-bisphosphoglycerate-independent phosphoglycerate mutase [Candidatus Bathyarchaeota archaeon]